MKQNLLIVPGWQDSTAEHWQSIWEKKYDCSRVIQDEWLQPQRQQWVQRLTEVIQKQESPPILIAHSMGCNTSVIVGDLQEVEIAGAFLVSPVDLDMGTTPNELKNFLPTPLNQLAFPTMVIASEDDPYCHIEAAKKFAKSWGSDLVSVGSCGHINVEAGLGDWPAGEQLLQGFLSSL